MRIPNKFAARSWCLATRVGSVLRQVASIFSLVASSTVVFAANYNPLENEGARVAWTTDGASSLIRLIADRARVGEIVAVIEQHTGTRFHGSFLSDESVSVVCEESDISRLLSCLFGRDAGIVIRGAAVSRPGMPSWPEDVWVVAYTAQPAGPASSHRLPTEAPRDIKSLQLAANANPASGGETARWIALASSDDPEGRIQGLQHLAIQATGSDPAVRGILQEAFVNGDAEARAQAVFGLGRNGGGEAIAVLERALLDQDASVRLMAVDTIDGAGESSALLRAALNDADETVRQLAALKLERISGQAAATQASTQ